jgi:hypothetical protein
MMLLACKCHRYPQSNDFVLPLIIECFDFANYLLFILLCIDGLYELLTCFLGEVSR